MRLNVERFAGPSGDAHRLIILCIDAAVKTKLTAAERAAICLQDDAPGETAGLACTRRSGLAASPIGACAAAPPAPIISADFACATWLAGSDTLTAFAGGAKGPAVEGRAVTEDDLIAGGALRAARAGAVLTASIERA